MLRINVAERQLTQEEFLIYVFTKFIVLEVEKRKITSTAQMLRCCTDIYIYIYAKFYIKATTNTHEQRRINPGCHVVCEIKLGTLAPNTCGPSVWELLHVALLASRILSLVPDSWEICGPLRMITWTDRHVDVLLVFS